MPTDDTAPDDRPKPTHDARGKLILADWQRTIPPNDDPAEIAAAAELTMDDADAAADWARGLEPPDITGLIDAPADPDADNEGGESRSGPPPGT